MSKKLFVGNLNWEMKNEDLRAAFAEFGAIEEAVVIVDKFNGRSKGFGFVTFQDDAAADAAVDAMNGKDVGGRPLTVNEARPKQN